MRTRPFHNEPAPFCESLAKYAVAFFKMSRSSRRTQFSFFNRFNSSNSAGVISTPPDLRSRATRTHLSIVLFPTPISKAACLMLKPRSSTSFTASTLYSSLYLCFPMTFPSLKRSITKPLHFCPVFWGRFKVQVTNPYKLRLIAESRQKTDENDAAILAELLRCGGLPRAVYVPPPAIRQLREQLSLRRQLIRIRTQVINGAKASMRRRGERYTARTFHTAISWKDQDKTFSLVGPLQGLWRQVEEERLRIEKKLNKEWQNDSVIQRLQTEPTPKDWTKMKRFSDRPF